MILNGACAFSDILKNEFALAQGELRSTKLFTEFYLQDILYPNQFDQYHGIPVDTLLMAYDIKRNKVPM